MNQASTRPVPGGFLGLIERIGNRLPDPVMLFLGATVLVMVISGIGAAMEWTVQPVRPEVVAPAAGAPAGGRPEIRLVEVGDPITPRSLVDSRGLYWMISNMIRNFINFPPLGVVLVSMFGIGVAERFGLFEAAMRRIARVVPDRALTPTVVFIGVCSNIASDAGYVVLPPLAAALYAAFGRPPLAGVAAAFAGIAGGFSANLLVGSTDALIAPLTERAARVLDPEYSVLATCNWYFLAASTFLLTFVGWFVTARVVEPRLAAAGHEAPAPTSQDGAIPREGRALAWSVVGMLVAIGVVVALIAIPGAPLHGRMPAAAPAFGPIPAEAVANAAPPATPRWTQGIVPLILVTFLVPGVVFGLCTGQIKRAADLSDAFIGCMKSMAPVIAVAFFAAQFLGGLGYSRMDAMLSNVGGKALVAADLPTPMMLVALIAITMLINMLMASMSAKWTALSAIVVPMLMMAGLSPELTQAAYRLGDSVTNPVTPLNTYIILILAACQRYRKEFGIGNVIAMMLPYSITFGIAWTLFLLGWVALEVPLGPGAPLWYTPAP
jgi:aminobenzoyl-glutamate transport protein